MMSIYRKKWEIFFLRGVIFSLLDGGIRKNVYAEGKLLFSDDFSNPIDSDTKWFLAHWGTIEECKIENSMLVLNGKHIQATIDEQTFTDFIIEVKVKVIKYEKKKEGPYAGFYGIGFRKGSYGDRWGEYHFQLSFDRYKQKWVVTITGGKIQYRQKQIPLDRNPVGDWHTFKLAVKGSNFKYYFDRELLIDVDDSTVSPSGCISLVNVAWDSELVCAFKDIKVYSHSENTTEKEVFSYIVPKDGVVSLGIYDTSGRLIKILISGEQKVKGKYSAYWDGKDELGNSVKKGQYLYKGISSELTYVDDGSVGNNGNPPYGETRNSIGWPMGIITDEEDNIYIIYHYDEAFAELRKYSPEGKHVWAIGIHGDGYLGQSIAIDSEYLYGGTIKTFTEEGKSYVQDEIRRFRCSDGVEESFPRPVIVNQKKTDTWVSNSIVSQEMFRDKFSLRGITVDSQYIYLSNYYRNQIEKYDKQTSKLISSFQIEKPLGTNFDKDGNLWIINKNIVSKYSTDGEKKDEIRELLKPFTLCFDSLNNLYVTDLEDNQIKKFVLQNRRYVFSKAIGINGGGPGKVLPNKFFWSKRIGASFTVDSQSNLIIGDVLNLRIIKLTPEEKEIFSLYSIYMGAPWVESSEPNTLYSGFFQYSVDYSTGKWKIERNLAPIDEKFSSGICSVIHKIKNHKFLFLFDYFKRVIIYNIDDEKIKGAGKYVWKDTNGNGKVEKEEVIGDYSSERLLYNTLGPSVYVDEEGNVYLADHTTIIKLPLLGFDLYSNPIYDWSKSQILVVGVGLLSRLTFRQVRLDPQDGSLYILGISEKYRGVEPFWAGGNVIVKYKDKKQGWLFPTPRIISGISIDDKYIYAGEGNDPSGKFAKVYIYTKDGLYVGSMKPGAASGFTGGWLDHGYCVFAFLHHNRKRYVYIEDDLYGKMIRYRIDDISISSFEGKFEVN